MSSRRIFRVWRPSGPLLELFTLSAAIWRLPPMGGSPSGLDWPQVQSLAAGLSVPWCRDTITCLQEMEAAAVTVWSRTRHDQRRS